MKFNYLIVIMIFDCRISGGAIVKDPKFYAALCKVFHTYTHRVTYITLVSNDNFILCVSQDNPYTNESTLINLGNQLVEMKHYEFALSLFDKAIVSF